MDTAPTFDTVIDETDIDPALFGLPSWQANVGINYEPRINRRLAIQVPAVKRARDMIAGTLGSLPLCLVDSDLKPVQGVITSQLLEQPEKNRPRSVTMAQ